MFESKDEGKSVEEVIKTGNESIEEAEKGALPAPVKMRSLNEIQETENKRNVVINLVDDVKRQSEDIDRLNKSMNYIAEQMGKLVDAFNKLPQNGQVAAPQGDIKNTLGELLQSPLGEKLISKLLPEAPAASPLISNEDIQKRMVESFYDDLNTGKSIRDFISGSLKKAATKAVINTSLKEIGNPNLHEPR